MRARTHNSKRTVCIAMAFDASLENNQNAAPRIQEVENVVIRFAGDSGDGIQVTGAMFTHNSAIVGNDISTLPDFPADILIPQSDPPTVTPL